MKDSMSSFDVAAMVRELQDLVGGRIDKVYHPELDHLVLAAKTRSGDKEFVHFRVGRWLYRSKSNVEDVGEPSGFAMMLRKRISGARIEGIRQQGFERIVVLTLDKEGTWELVLELFGDGNIILVQDGTIVQPLTSHTWKHRDVRAKRPFEYPPAVPDPARLSPEELLALLGASDADVVRTLATRLNLGGRYSEEVVARAGIPRDKKAAALDHAAADAILKTAATFSDEIAAGRGGTVVLKDGGVVDVVPVVMRTYDGLPSEGFPSFSEAIESYVRRMPAQTKQKPEDTEKELARLQRKVAQQEAAIMKLQDEGREAQMTGDALFAHYIWISTLLASAKARLLDSKPMTDLPGYIAYDQRTAILTVRAGPQVFRLEVKGTVESNAQRYYLEAKKGRRKLEGALKALEEARGEIAELREGQAVSRAAGKERHRPTKRFWFERFRWFLSSEGAVVLGGKDAKSNDLLVKKHLDAGDRYAHADMHGAPSVVVKMREGVTERTLLEACEFAVATSKAWNAKIGSAVGYWVLPEQVSKTPQSGEYLAKGAFVIRGRRNYSPKVEIRLGVGEVEFEGQRKIMCGPETAVRKHSKRFAIIRPGETDKNLLAKAMSDLFEVPIEEVQSILPPGDVEVVEQVGLKLELSSSPRT